MSARTDRDADVRLRTRPFPIVLSAPSGSGKTSVSQEIFKRFPYIRFAVSLTTRAQRDGEQVAAVRAGAERVPAAGDRRRVRVRGDDLHRGVGVELPHALAIPSARAPRISRIANIVRHDDTSSVDASS